MLFAIIVAVLTHESFTSQVGSRCGARLHRELQVIKGRARAPRDCWVTGRDYTRGRFFGFFVHHARGTKTTFPPMHRPAGAPHVGQRWPGFFERFIVDVFMYPA
jgi:hypothetical protein